MNKEIVEEVVYTKHFEGDAFKIRFKHFPIILKDDDVIDIVRSEGHYTENSAIDPYTELTIYRERLETDGEFEERKRYMEERRQENKESRRKKYMELKKEFDSESDPLLNETVEVLKRGLNDTLDWGEISVETENKFKSVLEKWGVEL